MPRAARSIPEPALSTPPSMRSSRVISRSSRSARSLTASSAVSAETGKRRRAPGRRTIVSSKDGDSTPSIMGDRPSGVQYPEVRRFDATQTDAATCSAVLSPERRAGDVSAASPSAGRGELGFDRPPQLLEHLLTGPQLGGQVGPEVDRGQVLGGCPPGRSPIVDGDEAGAHA